MSNSTDVDTVPHGAIDSTSMRIASSFSAACFFMWIGHMIREHLACTRKIYLPASLIGGIIALFAIQLCTLNEDVYDVVEHDWIVGWSDAPGFLINIIFGTLYLGSKIPTFKTLVNLALPQLAYGQVLAWSNWLVACLITSVLLMPVWDVHELFSSIFPIGYEGGHATARAMQESFELLGFPEGGDLAVTAATVGILCGVVLGSLLVNIGQSRGWTYSSYLESQHEYEIEDPEADRTAGDSKTDIVRPDDELVIEDREIPNESPSSQQVDKTKDPKRQQFKTWRDRAVIAVDEREATAFQTISHDAIDSFAINLAFVGLAILLAYILKRFLMAIEETSEWLSEYSFFTGFPLFPIVMLMGLLIQLWMDRFSKVSVLDRGTMERIGGISLDFLVLTAIATTNLDVVAESIGPLMVLLLSGTLSQLFCFFFLAPLMLPNFWFERAIAEAGKSFGTTSIGLLLLRMVDPENKTPALQCFSAKQALHEPFMGGGLFTSLSLPLIVALGNWVVFGIAAGFIAFWMLFWFFYCRPQKLGPMVQYKFVEEFNPLY